MAAMPEQVHRTPAISLLVAGCVLVILMFLAAFTIYGELAGLLGLVCLVSGGVLLGRANSAANPRRRDQRAP